MTWVIALIVVLLIGFVGLSAWLWVEKTKMEQAASDSNRGALAAGILRSVLGAYTGGLTNIASGTR